MQVDFGRTADDYVMYRAGFPEALFERLEGCGIGRAGQRILDLGSGTGSLARGFARRGARVTALDIAEELLAQTRALATAARNSSSLIGSENSAFISAANRTLPVRPLSKRRTAGEASHSVQISSSLRRSPSQLRQIGNPESSISTPPRSKRRTS